MGAWKPYLGDSGGKEQGGDGADELHDCLRGWKKERLLSIYAGGCQFVVRWSFVSDGENACLLLGSAAATSLLSPCVGEVAMERTSWHNFGASAIRISCIYLVKLCLWC